MWHAFMTTYGISDKDFTESIIQNLPQLEAVQYPVSRNLLIHELTELTMDPETNWEPFSKQRRREF